MNFKSFLDYFKEFLKPKEAPILEGNLGPSPQTIPAPYQPNEQGVRDIYKAQLGTANQESTNLDEYYPLLAESSYVKNKAKRPGMYELMMLMGLMESTGGKATNNVFGVKPGGNVGQFNNPREAIDYQVSPNVFGGGVGDSLNLLKNQGSLTEDEIVSMLEHYNPELAYKDWLLANYRKLRNK